MNTYFRIARKFFGPAWLTEDGESGLVGWASDVIKDAFTERLRLGLLARFPQQDPEGTPAADDALAAIGRDRRIVRGFAETSATYAARLLRWLDDWQAAGSAFALMEQLAAYCGPGPSFRTVDVRGNWYSRDAEGNETSLLQRGNWDWDNAANALSRWSRFWVIIYPNGLWTVGPKWGDAGAVWGTPGRTWGTTATPEQVTSIRSIISDWKPGGTKCVNVVVAFDSTSFDPTTARDGTGLPDGTWGLPSEQNGSEAQVPTRLSTARYWDGV